MQAMVFSRAGKPLELQTCPVPQPATGQVLLRVRACGVCRTDLHIIDGELTDPKRPLIPGHEIVGTVVASRGGFKLGDRVGVPWLGHTCGQCRYCRRGQENLCDQPQFTGYTIDGGYAEYAVADEKYCFSLPASYDDLSAAPLLCAGLIGYRSYRMIPPEAQLIGIYGFGAAAHIIAQIAIHQGKKIYAFIRPGDAAARDFALRLGAVWAGDSERLPPTPIDAAIIFAPVGSLLPAALAAVDRGGAVVCGGIHMSDIPSFPYHLLWQERRIVSVANLTRVDGEELLAAAAAAGVVTEPHPYPLQDANRALSDLRAGRIQGAAVLQIS